jgi:hypothetical protein
MSIKPPKKSANCAGRHLQNNFEEVAAKLQMVAPDAVSVLHAALFDGSPATRIRAASAIINLATICAEISELGIQVSALERRK